MSEGLTEHENIILMQDKQIQHLQATNEGLSIAM